VEDCVEFMARNAPLSLIFRFAALSGVAEAVV
jgi:hypothetical protein